MERKLNDNFRVCCKRKTETANFRLFAANGNGNLFSFVGKRYTVMDNCCFSKRANCFEYEEQHEAETAPEKCACGEKRVSDRSRGGNCVPKKITGTL
jgi:hypothetical protein